MVICLTAMSWLVTEDTPYDRPTNSTRNAGDGDIVFLVRDPFSYLEAEEIEGAS